MYGIKSEPPKNCLYCPLCQGEYGKGNEKSYCAIKYEVKLKYKGSRPKECPIIAEPLPQGEWKKNEHTFWTCSHCKWFNDMNRIKYNFCPNCGADMRKGGAE